MRGIDIRELANELVFRAFMVDSNGDLLTVGTSTLTLVELQSDGTLWAYDFNDHTFKSSAPTTSSVNMTHQIFQASGGPNDSGIWTYVLSTLTGFTAGNIVFCLVSNALASPNLQVREFQSGSGVLAELVSSDIAGGRQLADQIARRQLSAMETSPDGDALGLQSLYGMMCKSLIDADATVSGTITVRNPSGSDLGALTTVVDASAEKIVRVVKP